MSISEREIKIQVLCIEVNSKVKYHLTLKLWDEIDVELSRHEYQAVGK